MKPTDVYFEVETPLGVRIRTTKNYWNKIISIKHPLIAKYEKQVKESLKRPTEIRKSNQDPRVHLYYKNIGTAYLTTRIREGEKISKAFLQINVEN